MVALAGASLPDHYRATYEYDENSNLTLEKTNAYTYFNYTYARDNTKTAMSGMNGLEQLSWSYSYYRNGNLKTETHNGNVRGYAYDEQNRLRSETDGVYETIYTYDAFGNRASKRVEYAAMFRSETQYTYDAANRLKHAVETTEDGTNTTYYQYDANGNLTLRAREIIAPSEAAGTTALLQNSPYIDTFQFNDYGEMTSAYVNGKQCSYSYRPDGLRINKTVNGVRTRHVLDGQNVSMDLNDDWSTKFSFIRGVRLVGYIDGANGSKYFYNFNAHGDVLGAVGGLNSTAQTRYTYDAFGNSSKTGTSANPFGYFGQYHDAETGLIYLRARYYDPNAGRFISEDPVRDGMNWYAYANQNPVYYVDLMGEKPVAVKNYLKQRKGTVTFNTAYDETGKRKFLVVTMNGKTRKYLDYNFTISNGIAYVDDKTLYNDFAPTGMSDKLISFVAAYEGFFSKPYRGLDSQNRTVGYGHVITSKDGKKYDNGISQQDALKLLKSDLQGAANQLLGFLSRNTVLLSQNQFDALVSFTFNAGSAWMYNSTLRNVLLGGNLSNEAIYDAIMRWVYVNGDVAPGLVNRRKDEADLFLNGDYKRDY